jgi:hypothetical protein
MVRPILVLPMKPMRERFPLLAALALAGCTSPGAPRPVSSDGATTSFSASPALPLAPSDAAPSHAAATALPALPPLDPAPGVDPAAVLFPDAASTPPGVAGCLGAADPRDRVRCLFSTRYEGDAAAIQLATDLFEATGDVAGVEVEHEMEGGFRGRIHIVPEVPAGRYRRHLAWVTAALRDFDAFFAALAAPAKVRYRVRPLALHFFRSVGRTTPSAYAGGWSVSYNVSGSLFGSADAVRETLFHEVFHLNDADHDDWSPRRLRAIFDSIVARCGTRVACLRPYAPGDTLVKGGTYYAFQPDNGETVREYAAELALRWYREQRAVQRGERLGQAAFKCGPAENRRAWEAMVSEFFGGADAVPACP